MRAFARSFAGARSGSAALEFAVIAPLFLALCFSCFDGGWMMTKAVLFDRAVNRTVRLIRVGGADAPTTQGDIKAKICAATMIIPDCINVITVEMTKITTAADFPSSDVPCVDRGQKVQPLVNFTPGGRSSIMYIRACVVSNPFTPGLGVAMALAKDSLGGYSLRSSAAFMSEPGS